MRAVAELGK